MSEFQNADQKATHIAALIKEQAGYEALGKDDRANKVAEELRRLGDGTNVKKSTVAKRAGKQKEVSDGVK